MSTSVGQDFERTDGDRRAQVYEQMYFNETNINWLAQEELWNVDLIIVLGKKQWSMTGIGDDASFSALRK